MNVQELLVESRERWPTAIIADEWDTEPFDNFIVRFDNGWCVSVGYGRQHHSSTRIYHHPNSKDATTVEVAIFDADSNWYIAESMDTAILGKTGVLGWQELDQVLRIMDYISAKPGKARSPP